MRLQIFLLNMDQLTSELISFPNYGMVHGLVVSAELLDVEYLHKS